jgi:hypothetical protein
MTPAINIKVIDFGITTGNEMVTLNEDGSYTILINARQASNVQRAALFHALLHIRNEDFDKYDVQQIEAAAHGL